MNKVIDGIFIDDAGGILLVEKKGKRILPGGKMNDGESELEALQREVSEELSGAQIDFSSVEKYKDFEGETPFSKRKINISTYFTKFKDKNLEFSPSGEITSANSTNDFKSLQLSSITKAIIDALVDDGFLKS